MRIIIVNQPVYNRGDESAHRALIRTLLERIPGVSIEVLYTSSIQKPMEQFRVSSPQVYYNCVKNFKGATKIMIMGLNNHVLWLFHPTIWTIIRRYKAADLILCAPGGICMGGFMNREHMFYLHLAKFLHKPLAYYGRSIGPFLEGTEEQKKFKLLSLNIMNYFSFFSIRDTKSELLAKSLGFAPVSTVDTAFLETPSESIPDEINKEIGNTPYMVFVPHMLLWHFAYKNRVSIETMTLFYSKIISVLLSYNDNIKIVMLPQTYGHCDRYSNDVNFFRDLASLANNSRIIVIDDKYSSDIQQSIIKKSEFVVGARYHSIVFAINNEVPFISLSYEHKMSGLLETLNKKNSMIDIEHSMDNEQNVELFIKDFEYKLHHLAFDISLTTKAKQIANSCMDAFVKYCNTL